MSLIRYRNDIRRVVEQNDARNPRVFELQGQVSDIEIQANEILRYREVLNQILAKHTGQPLERIAKDTDRDFFLGAEDSKKYGLVDDILMKIPGPEGSDDKD